jgi:hypothetical protein
VLVSAAICPHPPLLLPGLTGAADVGAALRALCEAAVQEALEAAPDRVVIVGGAETTAAWDPATPLDGSPYGGPDVGRPAGSGPRLPLSLLVGRTVLDWTGDLALQAVSTDASPHDCAALGAELVAEKRTTLLVMGDGSARRDPKAPGYVDERALAYDADVTGALSRADAAALSALDPQLAADLLVAGRSAWQVLAGALGGRPAAGRLLHVDDPFGVLYVVATWRCAG